MVHTGFKTARTFQERFLYLHGISPQTIILCEIKYRAFLPKGVLNDVRLKLYPLPFLELKQDSYHLFCKKRHDFQGFFKTISIFRGFWRQNPFSMVFQDNIHLQELFKNILIFKGFSRPYPFLMVFQGVFKTKPILMVFEYVWTTSPSVK